MPGVTQALLSAAVLLSAIGGILMLRGAFRARTADGLSITMMVLTLFTSPMWVAYAVANHNWLQTSTSILWSAVTAVWFGFWFTDRGRAFWPAIAGMIVWVTALTAAALTVIPFETFGWIGGAIGVISSVPQMIALLRADHVGAGFTFSAWFVSLLSVSLWTAYGWFAQEMPIFVPDVALTAITATIIARAWWLSRREPVLTDLTIDEELDWILETAELRLSFPASAGKRPNNRHRRANLAPTTPTGQRTLVVVPLIPVRLSGPPLGSSARRARVQMMPQPSAPQARPK